MLDVNPMSVANYRWQHFSSLHNRALLISFFHILFSVRARKKRLYQSCQHHPSNLLIGVRAASFDLFHKSVDKIGSRQHEYKQKFIFFSFPCLQLSFTNPKNAIFVEIPIWQFKDLLFFAKQEKKERCLPQTSFLKMNFLFIALAKCWKSQLSFVFSVWKKKKAPWHHYIRFLTFLLLSLFFFEELFHFVFAMCKYTHTKWLQSKMMTSF